MIHFPHFSEWLFGDKKASIKMNATEYQTRLSLFLAPFLLFLCVNAINLKGQTYTIVNHTHTFPYLMEDSSTIVKTKIPNFLGSHYCSKPPNCIIFLRGYFCIVPLFRCSSLKNPALHEFSIIVIATIFGLDIISKHYF